MSTGTQRFHIPTLMAVCLCCVVIGLYITQAQYFRSIDNAIYDTFLELSVGGEPSSTPLFIDIDEKSLEKYGQWPWPRHVMASMVETLAEHKAAAIGMDILFVEPDRSSQVSGQDNDSIFAEILAKTPSVLATYVTSDKEMLPLPKDLPEFEIISFMLTEGVEHEAIAPLLQGTRALLPLPALRAVTPLGNIGTFTDDDGVARSLPLLTFVSDRPFFSLALRTYMRAHNIKSVKVSCDTDGLNTVSVGDVSIPVQSDGSVLIPYRSGTNVYAAISAADVLQGNIKQADIEGRICIIGTSAPGLHDMVVTPLAAQYPGAAVHLSLIDGIESGTFITVPAHTIALQLLCMLGIGLFYILVLRRLSGLVYRAILLCLCVIPTVASWFLFQNNVFFSPLYATLLVGVLAVPLRVHKQKEQ